MRVLYGVVGEGMGHATRSKVVLEHLRTRHEVEVAASGRARDFLAAAFPELRVHAIHGLTMVYEDNRVRKARTAARLVPGLAGATRDIALMKRIETSFAPELCIADFDSFAWTYGRTRRIPVFSIDNMQVIDRCRHTLRIPMAHRPSFRLARAVVRAKLARCRHYFITSFFFPEVRKPRTSLHPPILRAPILEARAKARTGGHVLVYQTSDSFRALVPILRSIGDRRFVVYGLKRDEELGNVRLKSFSEQGFVDDLASAAAVVAGGGFSLMGEAIYLGKPMYAVPLQGQFEQVLNALYLQELGYGEHHDEVSAPSIAGFLERCEGYRDRLAGYRQDGNRDLLAALDARIGELTARGGS